MESSMFATIIVGAISGVVSAALLWLVKTLFTNHFIPFYQKTVYRGSSIEGKWTAYSYENNERTHILATIVIKQFAHAIKATYTVYFKDNQQLVYECHGEYWESYLSITGRSTSSLNYNILSALLKQRQNGAVLQGDICCRHSAEDKPYTIIGLGFEREQ